MNIKSLLLGSAAALLAVSGARAADAVTVAEPEPAEYVKICDVYGAGYFYIPGTETCLRIGASMRYTIGIGDIDGAKARDREDFPDINNTYSKNAEVRINMSTGQETELGTLKTYTEFRLHYGTDTDEDYNDPTWRGYQNNSNAVSTNFAYMQLGGFRVGIDESAFSTFSGYAGNVINDTLIGYGPFTTGVLQYYFDGGNGLSGVISLEEGSGHETIDSYVPHVVGGVKYTQGWGDIIGMVAYDSNDGEVTGKLRADFNVSSALTLWAMVGYGSYNDDQAYPSGGVYGDNFKRWGGNWAVFGGGTYKFSEKAAFNAQVSYDEAKDLAVVLNVDYQPVVGFHVIPELNFVNNSDLGNPWNDKKSAWGGLLRFQRDF
jgi:hypothetical protein